jgi:3-methyladenine DNA glycosylase/8-oxoguanine DNA glycosylase
LNSAVESRSVPIEVPLDLRAVLAPLSGRFAGDGWWTAARTPEGPAGLRISRDRRHLFGDAWGDGAGWMLERLGDLAGLGDDPTAFHPEEGLVARLHRENPGLRWGRTDRVFDALIRSITAQKVTSVQAKAALRGLYRRFGDPAPGPKPDLLLPPDPEKMATAPYWEFHELHLERRRADLIRKVSAHATQIEALASAPPATAESALRAFPGIGRWTTASTLGISHGDPDQVPVGDYHIKHMVVFHLTGRPRGSDEEMLELLAPYRPHRGRVIRLLHPLGHEPKFGPKAPMRDITRI